MALLMLFGFVAGAATAVSPCVLPVLPIALSAGATGGRRRPLGIVAGLAVSFTFATVALVYVISALGLPDDLLRKLAIVVLIGFGVSLMIPPLAARIEAAMSRFAGRAGVKSGGEGFWSGTAVGASLGLVYAPCAGPILGRGDHRLGLAAVHGGPARRRAQLRHRLGRGPLPADAGRSPGDGAARPPRGGRAGRDGGGDGRRRAGDARRLRHQVPEQDRQRPAQLPGQPLEVAGGDAPPPAQRAPTCAAARAAGSVTPRRRPPVRAQPSGARASPSGLPVLGTAPEFVDTQRWFNTPGDRPLTLGSLRGRVVLVDFWTYSCINCLRTLPYLTAWDKRYRRDGLTIVGVHSPEFPFEKDAGNVEEAIARNGIRYPVVQDNDLATFTAYGTEFWPAEYFVDARGRVRYVHFGEGEYDEKEKVIRELLAEAGHRSAARSRRQRHRSLGRGDDAGELPRLAARRPLRQRPDLLRDARTSASPASRRPTTSPTAAAGGSRRSRRPRRAARSSSPSGRAASTWCSARPGRAAGCACCSTAARSPPGWPAPTSTTASSP